MSTITETTIPKNENKPLSPAYPALTEKFEWLYIIASTWFIIGAHIDGWSHNNTPELETFFTPSHAVLYTGMLAVTGLMLYYAIINYTQSYDLTHSLPVGYMGVLIGSFVFLLGGVGDGIWHETLGIEVNVEALYSPTHLILAIGAGMMVSGGLRHAWKLPEEFAEKTFKQKIPTFLSIAFFMSIITFFFQFAVPFHSITPTGDAFGPEAGIIGNQGIGMTGAIIYTILLIATVIKLFSHFGDILPMGMFTVILPVNVLFGTMMRFSIPGISNLEYISTDANFTRVLFIFIAIAVGYLIDLGISHLNNTDNLSRDLTIFAIVIPIILFSLYIFAIAITPGLGWSIHLAAGLPVVTGITGYLTRLILLNN